MPRIGKTEPAILDALADKHMLSGPDLLAELAQRDFRVNKTSVYRALERLLEKGQICRLSLGEQQIVYELRDHHHDHLVCQQCGQVGVIDCHVSVPQQIDGFLVNHHHATYFGVCAQCQAQ